MSEAARRSSAVGVAEAVAAASLWGSSGIFSVHLFRLDVTPGAVAFWRPLLALVFLVGLLALFRRSAFRVDTRGLLLLLVAGGGIVSVFQMAYQLSIDAVGVPSTVALLFLAPSMVVAAAGPVLGEWPTPRRVALAVLVAVGVWLSVVGAQDVEARFGSAGVWWGVAAAASYAGYTLLGRYASPRWGPFATVVYSTAGACVLLAFAVPLSGGVTTMPSSGRAWLLLAAYAFLTITVAQFLFYDALGRADAGRVSIAAAAEPVVAAILATLLLGQGLEPLGWLGLALVVVGVAGVAREGRAPAVAEP